MLPSESFSIVSDGSSSLETSFNSMIMAKVLSDSCVGIQGAAVSMRKKKNTIGISHELGCCMQGQVRHPCVLPAELEVVTPKCANMLHK